MSLVDKEDTLQVGAVTVVNLHFRLVLLKLLDVDHHDLQLAFVVLCDRPAGNVLHQFLTALGIMHDKTASSKLVSSLFHQVDAVNNEIKLSHNILLSEEVSKAANTVISQSRLAATLCVPNDTTLYSIIQCTADGIRSEHLLIAHNLLLQRGTLRAVIQFHLALNIRYAIAKQEQKALLAEH